MLAALVPGPRPRGPVPPRERFPNRLRRVVSNGIRVNWLPLHPEVKKLILELPRGISGFVFKFRGKPYSEKLPRKTWERACKKLGVRDLTLYQGTRHSVASDAVQRGVSLYDVMDALRHKDIRTTMRYAHMKMEGKQRVLLEQKTIKFPDQKKKDEK